jgi:hypothetical protein
VKLLVVARDELHRLNEYGTVRPDPYGVVLDALQKVPPCRRSAAPAMPRSASSASWLRDLLAAGLKVTVWNGGDDPELADGTEAAAIFAALAASDQDELTLTNADDSYAGWVRLVWGNDCDIISDYTTRLEALMAGANKLADELGQ